MPTVFMIIMLILVGRRHPPTIDEHTPLDRQRVWIAIAALIIFVLCFTPAPIQPMDLIRR
jgi:hypothetical protein